MIGVMIADPLKTALEEIEPKLESEMRPLVAALMAGEPVEDAWQALLREVLDEA